MNKVKFAKMSDNVNLPHRAHPGDAGFDIYANERVDVHPGQSALIKTGIKMIIPEGWCGQINPRSGLASKRKITVGARVIDSGYRGEVMINVYNNGDTLFEVTPKVAIAQILFLPVLTEVEEISLNELDETSRGEGGFGSTGRE